MYGDDNINNNDGDAHDAGDGDADESKSWAELSWAVELTDATLPAASASINSRWHHGDGIVFMAL